MSTGKVIASSSSSNPQRQYGADVMTRIAFACQTHKGVKKLQQLVIKEINSLIKKCLKAARANILDIDEILVVGNPTMQHLFCGWHPRSLGTAPYVPVSRSASNWRASDLGIEVKPLTNVHVFPVVSGFLGGDCLAALLAESPHLNKEITLLLDLGTNGEIVLTDGNKIWATSCATGPAFEGAHISCGMRAAPGAIHSLKINARDCTIDFDFYKGKGLNRPSGICGSGIIDAIAEMRRAGILLASGRLNENMKCVERDSSGIGRSFTLVSAKASATRSPLALTLDDIRQVQLAKGALMLGIRLLMESSQIGKIDRLVLTGGFGSRFNIENAVAIGMLPSNSIGSVVELAENSAGAGAVAALLSERLRIEATELSNRVIALNLTNNPRFNLEFPESVSFPALPWET
jgi:uncharacterized 2Fe-2S/4Fe-4S cluster protein (DUF4445 family)